MENSAFLLDLFNNIDVLMVILVRLTGFFMMIPMFSGTGLPASVRLLFLISLSYIIYSSNAAGVIEYYDSILGLGILLVQEFITGFSMGFVVYIIFAIMYMVGQFIDYQIGFSMVSVLDPVTQIQVPITGNLLNIFIILLLIRSGGFNAFVATIYRSFEILPPGRALILNNSYISTYIMDLFTQYFTLGVQFAMPIIGTILLVDICMGFLVKASPQMNVFVVGMPIKLIVGLIMLYATIPLFSDVYTYIYEEAMKGILNVMGGFLP